MGPRQVKEPITSSSSSFFSSHVHPWELLHIPPLAPFLWAHLPTWMQGSGSWRRQLPIFSWASLGLGGCTGGRGSGGIRALLHKWLLRCSPLAPMGAPGGRGAMEPVGSAPTLLSKVLPLVTRRIQPQSGGDAAHLSLRIPGAPRSPSRACRVPPRSHPRALVWCFLAGGFRGGKGVRDGPLCPGAEAGLGSADLAPFCMYRACELYLRGKETKKGTFVACLVFSPCS